MNFYYSYFTLAFRACLDCQMNKISEIHSSRCYLLGLRLHSESTILEYFLCNLKKKNRGIVEISGYYATGQFM